MSDRLRVLRVYHAGREASHRLRDRALLRAGADVHLVVPAVWPGPDDAPDAEPFSVHELGVVRPGDVNRHRYRDGVALERLIADVRPDVLDLHEEPFSAAVRQWLRAAPVDLPVVVYTAQNVDKRFPPPFHGYERSALRRAAALYPCSAQAAAVARGKGFTRRIEVLPLGFDETVFQPGDQSLDDEEIVLVLAGRLVPEKGLSDAVRVLAALNRVRPARLAVYGRGPAEGSGRDLARSLGVADRVEVVGWRSGADVAAAFRAAHVVLVPSRPTATWVEQFGRVIVEAQASGAVVAGYDSGSIAEVGGEAAVLVPVGDMEGLVRRVCDVATSYEQFAWRRTKGIERAARCTWDRVAERQAALYRTVLTGEESVPVASSPKRQRARARAEYGSTAATTAGTRPFALPLLRRGGTIADVLAVACDTVGEFTALARGRRDRRPSAAVPSARA